MISSFFPYIWTSHGQFSGILYFSEGRSHDPNFHPRLIGPEKDFQMQGCSAGMLSLCLPARMSASSMNWVLKRITRPSLCSLRRLHTWCRERGSSPAVGSSRSSTCTRDETRHSPLKEWLHGLWGWCSLRASGPGDKSQAIWSAGATALGTAQGTLL